LFLATNVLEDTVRLLATTLFCLWGLVHVAGGALMLAASNDPAAYTALVATAGPTPGELLPPTGSPALAVFAFHAWNILWAGLMVTGVALVLNRVRSRPGYWFNLAVVSGADVGLLLFFVRPGVMSLSSAVPGLVLWLPAAVTGYLALENPRLRAGRSSSAAGRSVEAS
jgi:hypothetical protein